MTLQEFSRDIIPIITAFISVLGLGSIVLLFIQMRKTLAWNKRMSFFSIHCDKDDEIENHLTKAYHRIGIPSKLRCTPLTKTEIDQIVADDDAYLLTMTFLDRMEDCCTAINTGLLDLNYSFNVYSSKYICWYKELAPFIKYIREKYKDPICYIEFEKVVTTFRKIRATELHKKRERENANKFTNGAKKEI